MQPGVTTIHLAEAYLPAGGGGGGTVDLRGEFGASPGGTIVRVKGYDITADLAVGDPLELDGVLYTVGRVQPRNNVQSVRSAGVLTQRLGPPSVQ